MKEIAKKIAGKLMVTEKSLSERNGKFQLFALMLREDALDKWDLVVAAPWIEENRSDALKLIVNEVKTTLTDNEILVLSRIVIMNTSNPGLEAMISAVHSTHSLTEIKDCNFSGLQIKHMYLITSQRI